MKVLIHVFAVILLITSINGQTYRPIYSSAAEALAKNDTASAISIFRESISKNRDAASYYGVAKILSKKKLILILLMLFSIPEELLNWMIKIFLTGYCWLELEKIYFIQACLM